MAHSPVPTGSWGPPLRPVKVCSLVIYFLHLLTPPKIMVSFLNKSISSNWLCSSREILLSFSLVSFFMKTDCVCIHQWALQALPTPLGKAVMHWHLQYYLLMYPNSAFYCGQEWKSWSRTARVQFLSPRLARWLCPPLWSWNSICKMVIKFPFDHHCKGSRNYSKSSTEEEIEWKELRNGLVPAELNLEFPMQFPCQYNTHLLVYP